MSGLKLSAPKKVTWMVAVGLGALGILLGYGVVNLGALNAYSFLLVAGAFVLLAVASLVNRL